MLSVPRWEGNKESEKEKQKTCESEARTTRFFYYQTRFSVLQMVYKDSQKYQWKKKIKYLRLQDLIIEIFSMTHRATWNVLLSIQNKTNHGSGNALKYTVLWQFTHSAITEMFKGF